MKVILLQDVKKVGKKGEIVEVSDGYAANFLFPKKLAVKESKKSVEILEQQKEDARLLLEKQKEEALKIKEQLKDINLEFKLKSNAGKVFGSISFKQVEEELKNKYNIVIDKRKITSKGPIDQLGFSRLDIVLFKGVVGQINVHVMEE